MMLKNQMNDGNSPPLNVHASLKYWKKYTKSKPGIRAYAAVHAVK